MVSPAYIYRFTVFDISGRDSQFYMGEFRTLCAKEKMTELKWPERDYIVQIARFDPAKGDYTRIFCCAIF